MRFQHTHAFESQWKRLTGARRIKATEALSMLEKTLKGGEKPEGLGLKKLRNPFWEIRIDLKDRLLFSFDRDLVTLILIGSHDELHRYLRNQ